MTPKQKFLLVLIIFLAVFFRFYLIQQMPGGLFPDEAANGIDINSMQSGQLQPFYERGNGREALFFYMLWGSVEAFGKGPWQHHAVSALVGVLSVLTCFALTRRLFLITGNTDKTGIHVESRATNIALLASFLMAVSSWHVVLSRTAFRANLIALFAALTIYFLLRLYQSVTRRQQYYFSILAGASFALGFYTYIAYRILVPILVVAVLWPWIFNGFFKQIKIYWKAALIFVVSFVIFFAPLFHYFYTHPGSFVGRSGQVSVFNPDLNQGNLIGAIGTVFSLSIKAYFIDGDLNWRHNISGWPFLSELVSPFFGIGLAVVTLLAVLYMFSPRKRSSWWKYFLLAGWFWGMLLPVITTAEGIPHGLRSIGTIPVVFIISAWVLYFFAEKIYSIHQRFWHRCLDCHHEHYVSTSLLIRRGLTTWALKLVAACFFVALILQTYFGYFVYAYNSPENFYAFRSDLTVVSNYLKQRCKQSPSPFIKDHTYLVLDKFSVQTTDYLTSNDDGNFKDACNVPYQQVDPEDSWKLSGLKKGDVVVFTQSSIFDIKKFKEHHPDSRLIQENRNKFGQAVLAVYEVQ